MNKAELERMLEEQAAQKTKTGISINRDRLRAVLNALFLILAFAGLVIYFFGDPLTGQITIGAGLVVKILEFLVRFLL